MLDFRGLIHQLRDLHSYIHIPTDLNDYICCTHRYKSKIPATPGKQTLPVLSPSLRPCSATQKRCIVNFELISKPIISQSAV